MDRQEFIRQGLRSGLARLAGELERFLQPLAERTFIRPPGAQPEALFKSLCTRCDACTAACPYEAISVHYGSGDSEDGLPVLANLREHPCLLCEDTPCITACPTEALLPVADIREIRMGTAVIDRLACTAYQGSGCRVCYDVCPIKDEAIELVEGLPIVVDDACTGCGICQHHCPEEPEAIAVLM